MFDDFDLFQLPDDCVLSDEEEYDYGISSVIAAMSLIQTLQERRKRKTKQEKKITN